MSPALIIVIVVGGLIVVAGLIVAMMVWLRKSYDSEEGAILDRLRAEAPQRGWTFEERADSYVQAFNDVERYRKLSEPVVGFASSPKALRAHDVVSGQHRGRSFVAARFHISRPPDTRQGGGWSDTFAIWVGTPTPGPTLDVRSVPRAQSVIGDSLGVGDLRIGHAEFDARYQVTAENEHFARAVLTPPLVDFMLGDGRDFRGFWIRGGQLEVLDTVSDHRDPAELVPALDLRCDILDRISPQAWA
jgi:hypothetical protein